MAINIIQITALLIFSCMAITHRLHVKEGDPDWTLDSTGTPTQYVQDSTPNMIQDPKFPNDPTKQIPDPSGATSPKVDSNGNPIDVMYAADAKGNVINDSSGNPLVVATDANGKIADLTSDQKKAGATQAIAEINTISYKGGMVQDPKTGIWHSTIMTVPSPSFTGTPPMYIVIQGVSRFCAWSVSNPSLRWAKKPRIPRSTFRSPSSLRC